MKIEYFSRYLYLTDMINHLINLIAFDLVKPKGISIHTPVRYSDNVKFYYDNIRILKCDNFGNNTYVINEKDEKILIRYIIVYSVLYIVYIDIIHFQD